ncbi:MAG: NADH-quinone oxidoreductase subunit C [Desulfurococcaceae archaeon]|nr:NADH-quinone oxidoreductase subunit C [Desulfurococcaceae archaeon]
MVDVVKTLYEVLGGKILRHEVIRDGVVIDVRPEDLVSVVKGITEGLGGIYTVVVGVDGRGIDNTYHSIYVFSLDELKTYVLIRVRLSPEDPKVESITPIVKGANWGEREVRDLLGIEVLGHPDPRTLILPDGWPSNTYPLRKDFSYCERPRLDNPGSNYVPQRSEEVVALPYGPYHPLLHEPEYFELHVKGETVVDVEYRGFHVHRGIEKLGESRLTYNQVPFVAERICGICGFVHNVCYCQAVENAAGIEVPERALYIRSLVLEVERIHSHLLWLGVACHVLGFDTGFMHAWRIREPVMYLAELLTGSRKTYGINLVGGVRRDVNRDSIEKVVKILKKVKEEYDHFVKSLTSVKEVVKRLEGSGILPKSEAISYGVVGPTARGSGLKRDVRVDHPYAAYKEASFRVPVYSECDNMSRLLVRVDEVYESISIIDQLIDKLPSGPIMAEDVEVPEFREGFSGVEAPRGEDVHYVITGRFSKVYRWKVRAPSYNNIPALKVMLHECPLSDAPLTIASIDPCFSCTDRLVVVDVLTGRKFRVDLRTLARRGKL